MNGRAPKPDRIARYKKGRRAEWYAAAVLALRGYRILHVRYKTPLGEIDVIAKRGRRIAFVEVKRRRTLDDALNAITPKLQHRVCQAATLWLRRHAPAHDGDVGYDVMAIVPGARLPILRPHYLKDAFDHR